jgi:hypothetical protein
MFIVLGALIVFAAFFIWTKELHHHSSGSASSTTPAASVPTAPSMKTAPATTVPGGIPVSNRNPFQG